MQPRHARPAVTAVGGVVVVLFVVLLGTWAASIGPGGVFHGRGHVVSTETPSGLTTSFPTDSDRPPAALPATGHGAPQWVVTLGLVVQGLLVVALLVLLVRLGGAFRRQVRERRFRARAPAAPAVAFEVLDDPTRLSRELAGSAGRRRELLAEGSPRNGIVRCWHEFEVTAGGIGLVRRPWETSAEFTLRLLDLVAADGTAVTDLAARYREARFSDHDVTEADREAALSDLDRIDASLGLGVP